MMNYRAWVAELIGTFALVFVGVGAIAMDYVSGGKLGLVGIALAFGLAIAVMGTALAPISGGHFNPAVTLGVLVGRKIDFGSALMYMIFQCVGAVLASYAIVQLMPPEALQITSHGITALGTGITESKGLILEVILSFFLVFAVYGTAIDSRAPKLGALLVGLVVTADIFAGGPVTGACMNPARWLGPALISNNWQSAMVYIAGPILGGVLAGLIYSYILMEKPEEAPEKV